LTGTDETGVELNARILYEGCPLCAVQVIEHYADGDCSGHALYKPALPAVIRWMRCKSCGHVFTEGYYTDEALAVLFSDTHDYQTPGWEVENWRIMSARMVEQVEAARSYRQGRWLDVGFGNGALMTTADEFGWHAVGLDLRQGSVDLMRQEGFEAHAVDIADFSPKEPFDVISMADVMEHMPFPKPALRQARRILKPDGLLFLSMPNMDAYAWSETERIGNNPYWGELEHYHNFGRRRLYSLLEECGFAPLRYTISERYRICMQVLALRASE
jgi:SAM-dependent methyltransferase